MNEPWTFAQKTTMARTSPAKPTTDAAGRSAAARRAETAARRTTADERPGQGRTGSLQSPATTAAARGPAPAARQARTSSSAAAIATSVRSARLSSTPPSSCSQDSMHLREPLAVDDRATDRRVDQRVVSRDRAELSGSGRRGGRSTSSRSGRAAGAAQPSAAATTARQSPDVRQAQPSCKPGAGGHRRGPARSLRSLEEDRHRLSPRLPAATSARDDAQGRPLAHMT